MVRCEKIAKNTQDESGGFPKFLMLFLLGFFMIIAGIAVLIVAAVFFGQGSMNFGAIIFIGPIPIVVGAGPEATLMVLFAIVLAFLSIIMYLVLRRGIRKESSSLS